MNRIAIALLAPCMLVLLTSWGDASSKDGPRRWTKVLKKKTTVEYKIAFVAGQKPAEFSVIGDGSTDVDIHVLDSKGAEIARDVFLTDLAFVRWTVGFSQTYTIRVKNLGDEDNECTMGHN